jgi:dihydroorotase
MAETAVLRGGHLIDPKNGVSGVRDIEIRDGKIHRVVEADGAGAAGAERARGEPPTTFDVSGLVVTPGLVDIHTHLFTTTGIHGVWAGDNSVMPDGFSFRTGTTTMADTGSSGWRNVEDFRLTVIDRCRTRVFAFINVAGFGMISNMVEQDSRDFRPDAVAEMAEKHRDVVVGVKTAHYEHPDWRSVDAALEAGRLAGLPVMVDFGYFRGERPYWKLVTERLRPGDISTHCYRAAVPYLDQSGRLLPYLTQARERGIRFDVGHGAGSFLFRNAVPAMRLGFPPDSISTDLHAGSMNAAMIDMPTTMSKFLAMGMSLEDVVACSTWAPARMIGHPELGHLSPGAVADLAVWRVLEGDFGYRDTSGGGFTGHRRLLCEMTVKDGEVVWDWNGRTGVPYEELGPTYGMREGGADVLVLPG